MRIRSGSPERLGATCSKEGVNFAIYSKNATGMELCLFDQGNERRIDLQECTRGIWHTFIEGATSGTQYGYRAHGPWNPDAGHRFNPAKLLLDPYARALTAVPGPTDLHYDYQRDNCDHLLPDEADNVAVQPKCLVTAELADLPRGVNTRLADTLLYEVHIKGFSQTNPAVPELLQGRYGGFGHHASLAYLKSLGVTTVELLPVHEFASEAFLADRGQSNYWGYNSIGYFMPTARYACNDARTEFRDMVRAIHDAGLEVILDVVYNHTAESGRLGPTFSFRGLDNATYYRLKQDGSGDYIDDTGCGNSLNLNNTAVLRLVMDSLRFWVIEMGVDGFRFDLATTLARRPDGFSPDSEFFAAIIQDPVLANVKLIVEPWDLGPGGYQRGQFPEIFSEWNDSYRDTVRRFWRGDGGLLPGFAAHIHGSSDVFEHRGRPPQAGVNFVTAHDGFTLADLVSYTQKHNEENGEANADGRDENYSFNCGLEGPTADPNVTARRARQQRNLIATLFLSQGLPMLLSGDECGRTQHGNNNAYCQDNELSWFDWQAMDSSLLEFVKEVIQLRQQCRELRSHRFIHGARHECYQGQDEIDWYHPAGALMAESDWQDTTLRAVGLMLHGELIFDDPGANIIYTIFNADSEALTVTLPAMPGAGHWRHRLTSALAPLTTPVSPGDVMTSEDKSVNVFIYEKLR